MASEGPALESDSPRDSEFDELGDAGSDYSDVLPITPHPPGERSRRNVRTLKWGKAGSMFSPNSSTGRRSCRKCTLLGVNRTKRACALKKTAASRLLHSACNDVILSSDNEDI